jgi:hypothetical protein
VGREGFPYQVFRHSVVAKKEMIIHSDCSHCIDISATRDFVQFVNCAIETPLVDPERECTPNRQQGTEE